MLNSGGMMLGGKALLAVITLSDCESFQDAANLLNMSPAAFSRHIKTAEDYAGYALFIRGRSKVRPTEQGLLFIRHARELHDAALQFDAAAKQLRRGPGVGLLRIACGPLTTRTLVAPALRLAVAQFPNLRFRIDVRADFEPMIALKRRETDLFVGDLTHTPLVEGIETRVVEKRPIMFVAAADHPLLQGGPHGLPDILRYPLLSPFLHRHWRNTIAMALGRDAAAPDFEGDIPAIQCDDYALLVHLVAAGNYICGGVRENFSEGLASGNLREIPLAGRILWNICVGRRKETASHELETVWSSLLGTTERSMDGK